MFEVTAKRDVNINDIFEGNYLVYNHTVLNTVGDAINLETGVFTVPKSGTYQFIITATSDYDHYSYAMATIRVNGEEKERFLHIHPYGASETGHYNSHSEIILKVNEGDEVALFLNRGYIDTYDQPYHFRGKFLF